MPNPNVLDPLIPDLINAVDVISRELVGFIPGVATDMTMAGAAIGQTVKSPVAPVPDVVDLAPSMVPTQYDGQEMDTVDMTLTKMRGVPLPWTGEDQLKIARPGPGFQSIRAQQFAQAMRKLTNEVERDIGALSVYASRAWGTPGTTPFASNLSDPAQVRKILDDNGAPLSDRSLVINTTSGAALRSLANLNSAGDSGTTGTLRQGALLDLHGFAIRESAGVRSQTKGTGSGYLLNGTHTEGDTALTVDGGSGTVLAGDVITIANDSNKYLVTAALAGGVITIAAPGLRQAAADNAAVTVLANSVQNLAFARSAIVLATRTPALPEGGDAAADRTIITDPRSGLSFSVAMYKGTLMNQIMVSLVWGVKAVKPEHMAVLLG